MALHTETCPVCGREYQSTDEGGRPWCSVGCQFSNDDPQDCVAITDSLRQQLAVKSAALADVDRRLRATCAHWEHGSVDGVDRVLFVGDVGNAVRNILREPDVEHAVRVEAARDAVIQAAQRLVDRTVDIDEKHPAYGFVVMAIPLAKVLAKLAALGAKGTSDV